MARLYHLASFFLPFPILELEQSGVSVRREDGSIRSRDIYRRFGKEA